jgi:hypothetical protein
VTSARTSFSAHGDDARVDRTVTYTNTSAQAITLNLAVDSTLFELSADSVVVPANGTATVKVSADPNAGAAGTTI